jgi:hypothetical protein
MRENRSASDQDLTGFIDGFQARNLASIERNTSLQLSEMQTRVSIVLSTFPPTLGPTHELFRDFSDLKSQLFTPSGDVVSRLQGAGSIMSRMMNEHSRELVENERVFLHFKGLVTAYIEAAQASGYDVLLNQAFSLATAVSNVEEEVSHGSLVST